MVYDPSNFGQGPILAWVRFTGDTVAVILNSYNVASVDRTDVGAYTITFERELANTFYVVNVDADFSTNFNFACFGIGRLATGFPAPLLTTGFSMYSGIPNGSASDIFEVHLTVIGNKKSFL